MSGRWEELVSAALVGTDRRPYDGDLLGDAAVEVVRLRAGQSAPEQEPRALTPAPEEEREVVGAAAAARLARILGGEHPRVLPEWLAAAAAAGRRVPPQALPELLDKGARDRSIRAHLGVLAGRRGRWLAGLNPSWAYLLEEPTGEIWELGSQGDRRAYLGELRGKDPEAARVLLEEAWEKETPDDRARFLPLLDEGLSMADEPFLESALDDRRREVRQVAADLLTRLPDSRLAARMADRAARCLRVEGATLVVEPPAACDRAMERDGIRARPPRGTGSAPGGCSRWSRGRRYASGAPRCSARRSPSGLVRCARGGCGPRCCSAIPSGPGRCSRGTRWPTCWPSSRRSTRTRWPPTSCAGTASTGR
ncbi:DUF5691 domain-containing protein [Nonomuraea recticatena]|uniref:DUF5691 domain-containing protein n=1 Tax=Nonomuraea recticatena TaxID=46178 RepID=UPI003619C4D4